MITKTSSPHAQRNALISLVVISVIFTVGAYRQVLPNFALNNLFFHFVVPLLVILLAFRENPLRYGLGLGNWREGLVWIGVGSILMGMMALLFWTLPDFRVYYTPSQAGLHPAERFWSEVGSNGLYMFGWEFLFRGFLLFALARWFGADAIWIQMVPFALAHLGKPEWETYSSIPGGLLSGWIAYRVGSYYPSWFIHWALAISISWLAVYGG